MASYIEAMEDVVIAAELASKRRCDYSAGERVAPIHFSTCGACVASRALAALRDALPLEEDAELVEAVAVQIYNAGMRRLFRAEWQQLAKTLREEVKGEACAVLALLTEKLRGKR